MNKVKQHIILYTEGILNSYSQIFFSTNKLFALLLMFVTFFDVRLGFSGLLAILIGQFTATVFNFNKEHIRSGAYTFNAVLVGIAIANMYEYNLSFIVLLIIASILVFFLTLWFSTSLAKRGLPYLSIPFIITIWIVVLSSGNFFSLKPNIEHTYFLNNIFPGVFNETTQDISGYRFANIIYLYLRSLGAIFFQYNDLAGIFIVIGLLIYSRIAFVLSVFGFVVGYLFYYFLQGDFTPLVYTYIGFNFILTSIALGGFFVVASKKSFLLILFMMPIIGLLISSLNAFFINLHLPIYSLPFNIVVLLCLSALYLRPSANGLQLVGVQQYSPEKNHYKFINSLERFSAETYYHITLPIIGEWHISQGHSGNITHKEDWKYAFDFDLRDIDNKSFKLPGDALTDFYCYDLPVLAPADGWIVTIVDTVLDNEIGEVNLENNWGNSIIIKHGELLYSKLSHLKHDSIKVKVGDFVRKGNCIATVGNSGRSPEPHLHFQIQTTPYIGSKTVSHPISYYLTKENEYNVFHSFDIPKQDEIVSNVLTTKLLLDSFNFIPGEKVKWLVKQDAKKQQEVQWEIFTNTYNQSYIYCHTTKSTAYFVNNGTLFYFTDFYGDKNSFLHSFYLAAHRVLLAFYEDIVVNDKLLIDSFFNPLVKNLHDFTAPFFHYCTAEYQFQFISTDDEHLPTKIIAKSICEGKLFGKKTQTIESKLTFDKNTIHSVEILNGKHKIIATCVQ